MLITSPANQQLKLARRVRDGREEGLIFVEGERLSEECLASGLELAAGFHSPAPSARARALIAELHRRACPLYEVTDAVLATVSDTVNAPGIIILAAQPAFTLAQVCAPRAGEAALIVALDAVQDPGNLGTIARTAEAAGASGLVVLPGSADAYAPKTLRSAMGSAFRLPMARDAVPDELWQLCRAQDITIAAAAADASLSHSDYDWQRPTLLLLGNEARGIQPERLAQCDVRLRIPLHQPVESLNVAAAAAVMLFEAARQRRSAPPTLT
jgi:TrmH family RNA methyltransferase